eukprot:UN18459
MAHWNGSIWEATWFELLVFLIMYYIIYTVLHVFCDDDQRENFYKFSNMAVLGKIECGNDSSLLSSWFFSRCYAHSVARNVGHYFGGQTL